jgi:hypothetical protein
MFFFLTWQIMNVINCLVWHSEDIVVFCSLIWPTVWTGHPTKPEPPKTLGESY